MDSRARLSKSSGLRNRAYGGLETVASTTEAKDGSREKGYIDSDSDQAGNDDEYEDVIESGRWPWVSCWSEGGERGVVGVGGGSGGGGGGGGGGEEEVEEEKVRLVLV
ncbi:hypothetical protein GX50_06293 [[Emmonsia] crescens]|uniref:Uncharacterized protein n=1 Tax=[Emmonsia] crescens TaxID=73230 RepID=A0A2B7ZAE4_9EURO|nr:hypothetical protein GX50_06293 [Emmonsia crescens]